MGRNDIPHVKFYASVGVGLASVVSLQMFGGVARNPARASSPLADDATVIEWCADGLSAIRGGGCFAAPAKVDGEDPKSPPLVLYLHGLYPPGLEREELERQSRVARIATAKGYAVLALRGEQGECKNPDAKDLFCWPSNARNEVDGATFVKRFDPALADAEKRSGGFGPRYLIGFSNGGYFASLIATRQLMKLDGVAIAHAGSVGAVRAPDHKPPLLLLTADDDPSDPEMAQLDVDLTRERWKHVLIARDGGHALLDWEVERSVTFFTRTRTERWPLVPGLGRGRGAPTTITSATTTSTSTSIPTSTSTSTPSSTPTPTSTPTPSSPPPGTPPATDSDL